MEMSTKSENGSRPESLESLANENRGKRNLLLFDEEPFGLVILTEGKETEFDFTYKLFKTDQNLCCSVIPLDRREMKWLFGTKSYILGEKWVEGDTQSQRNGYQSIAYAVRDDVIILEHLDINKPAGYQVNQIEISKEEIVKILKLLSLANLVTCLLKKNAFATTFTFDSIYKCIQEKMSEWILKKMSVGTIEQSVELQSLITRTLVGDEEPPSKSSYWARHTLNNEEPCWFESLELICDSIRKAFFFEM